MSRDRYHEGITRRLARHKARTDELMKTGLDRNAASKQAYEELVQKRIERARRKKEGI